MTRKYSLDEIDRIRHAVASIIHLERPWRSFGKNELMEETEVRLRTILMAGIEPAEVEAKQRRMSDAYHKRTAQADQPATSPPASE